LFREDPCFRESQHATGTSFRRGRAGHPGRHSMSRYEGRRTRAGAIVTVDGELLDLRLDLRNHSPTGFQWGYGGSGSAQLALAVCAHALGGDERAEKFYQQFKWAFIAPLPRDEDWEITADRVREIVREIETGKVAS